MVVTVAADLALGAASMRHHQRRGITRAGIDHARKRLKQGAKYDYSNPRDNQHLEH